MGRDEIGIWEWASKDKRTDPDVVLACAGDVPTQKTLAAVQLLREYAPDLTVRVVNVVDLMTPSLQRNIHMVFPTGTSTRCSPRTSLSSLRIMGTPG